MALGPFSAKDHVVITTLGLEFAVAVSLGVGLGFWLDKKWGSFPWGTIIGVFLGFALAMYIIIKEANRLKKADSCVKDKNKNGSL